TSTVLFSASISTKACPALTTSPGATLMSSTAPPSRLSPSWGSLISLAIQPPRKKEKGKRQEERSSHEMHFLLFLGLRLHQVRFVRIDVQLTDGLGCLFAWYLAAPHELR